MEVIGSVAYTSQIPWILNKTIRQNITYNMDFDIDKYVDTLQYCQLEKDLIEDFMEGDNTLIGEKGVNLSGG